MNVELKTREKTLSGYVPDDLYTTRHYKIVASVTGPDPAQVASSGASMSVLLELVDACTMDMVRPRSHGLHSVIAGDTQVFLRMDMVACMRFRLQESSYHHRTGDFRFRLSLLYHPATMGMSPVPLVVLVSPPFRSYSKRRKSSTDSDGGGGDGRGGDYGGMMC
eukprot:TRINITY_DN1423_c0_g1_i3.p1 TRINITY_DN1423_c0_g1~~TRINITY_DN1423_c0_g1_i3.p1  ORF type:complete len:164 (-),score=45.47 TRINITY_DN1423_c0_g1_i3:419-910(-)